MAQADHFSMKGAEKGKTEQSNKTVRGQRSSKAEYRRIRIRLAYQVLYLWADLGFPSEFDRFALASARFLKEEGKDIQ